MTPQEYIQIKLDELKEPDGLKQPTNKEELIEVIFKVLTSKKFCKYSLTPEYASHIKNAIKENVQNNQPINLTFLGGCYKLWRLEEAPESEWAELFAHMYLIRWVKPVCELYSPGVWFDFFLDDIIVPRINNITETDVESYRTSRQRIIDFLKPYMSKNIRMTLTGVGEQFGSREAYEKSLDKNIKELAEALPGGLPKLTNAQIATADLNIRVTPEQQKDPMWREKVELVHSAYLITKAETNYSTSSDKIRVFTQPFSSGACIAVGTTKDSIVKFWVGVGALKPKDDSYRQVILSLSQLEKASYNFKGVNIEGLHDKKFKNIRVLI